MLKYTIDAGLDICRVSGHVLWDCPLNDPKVLQWRLLRRKWVPSKSSSLLARNLPRFKSDHMPSTLDPVG